MKKLSLKTLKPQAITKQVNVCGFFVKSQTKNHKIPQTATNSQRAGYKQSDYQDKILEVDGFNPQREDYKHVKA
ncbi:hypothetical protein Calhy_2550 [Caldicellulosiruptor hydrothermalis 108]|uniref:Uncharacterized protein n=1 Tax=Caldicellulosiruptor hydrothermalis (strain DSM 18901 / VKM B-2411 / 108) TaxID=632292 RepID=E4QAD6_CALH1|nr:hypothetical protein [Caldicellulosiruptor hydrothermalis]ADQ08240.1 hypothetical protein Calhy_2550 [Caldicellulosiruptor hydrothermalis 108]